MLLKERTNKKEISTRNYPLIIYEQNQGFCCFNPFVACHKLFHSNHPTKPTRSNSLQEKQLSKKPWSKQQEQVNNKKEEISKRRDNDFSAPIFFAELY